MIPASTFQSGRLAHGEFGKLFLCDDGEKFFVGRAGDGSLVAVMLEGDFGSHRPFYFADLESWTRRGVMAQPQIVVDPSSIARTDAIPPGAIALNGNSIHIAGFSGQSYQDVLIKGEGGEPETNAVAFTSWAASVQGADEERVELFSFKGSD
jgi:hypothetical protein